MRKKKNRRIEKVEKKCVSSLIGYYIIINYIIDKIDVLFYDFALKCSYQVHF